MDIDTLTLIALISMFAIFMAVELLRPANRNMPHVARWRLIGVGGLIVTMATNALAPLVLLPMMPHVALVDIGGWGIGAALPVVVLTTFFTYWSHRIQHRFDLLWRLGHQLHHGVARVDIASAAIFHPIDVCVQVAMTLLAGSLLGATPVAAAIAGVLGFFLALYQHWNIDTPRWTGWFIQRPEAHMLHHQRDVHARNFGDMPVWDMIFGTFANPLRADDIAVGFEPERSRRWLAMVACIDVNRTEGRIKL
jgi:sterol desaturase/sphingolipid hydroxylase (fatty acid hydroxylase superfamily)